MKHQRKRSSKVNPTAQAVTLNIDALGHQGDGLSTYDGKTIYVPFTLAGEVVEAQLIGSRAHPTHIVEASNDRVEPICGHFTKCGGCSAQHLEQEAYRDWKREQVVAALSSRGIETNVEPVIALDIATRRRATFVARRVGGKLLFGYHRAKDKTIEPLQKCPLLVPEISSRLKALLLLTSLATPTKGELRCQVLSADNGLDVVLSGVSQDIPFELEQKLIMLATKAGFARLAVEGEVLYAPEPPKLTFGSVVVEPPVATFTQAAKAAENTLADIVADALSGCRNVADLFSGCGTFALRLAQSMKVSAFEMEGAPLNALQKAADNAQGLKPVKTEKRDLFRRPVMAAELKKFNGVVLDPPRAGATEQCEQIAKSELPIVAYVSCSPASFARDARILLDGGYELLKLQPVDQFLFSHHIELVGIFRRP